jgi:putative transposase
MLLSHRIRIEATSAQRDYFARAAGTARRVWNWALAEWQRQAAAGQCPNATALKRQFNATKYAHPDWQDQDGQPWLRSIHRDAHAQPFAHLARAFARYFSAIKARAPAHAPRFKRKGRCRDSFYVANDKFRIEGKSAVLPKLGRVDLAEALRFTGKIMGAAVSREADWWCLAVQVEVPGHLARRACPSRSTGPRGRAPWLACMRASPGSGTISPTSSRPVSAANTRRWRSRT